MVNGLINASLRVDGLIDPLRCNLGHPLLVRCLDKISSSYIFPIFFRNSRGVTTIGVLGKCFVFPVTRKESSWDKATS